MRYDSFHQLHDADRKGRGLSVFLNFIGWRKNKGRDRRGKKTKRMEKKEKSVKAREGKREFPPWADISRLLRHAVGEAGAKFYSPLAPGGVISYSVGK